MPTRQTHLVWADITRILAILLVVVLHTFSVSEVSENEDLLIISIRVIAKICVPLFIMLSGALLLPKQESWTVFFKKRLRRVLLPWLFWTLVVLVVFSSSSLIHPLSLVTEFKRLFSAEFTFLPLIFSLYLLIPALQIIVKHGQERYVMYLLTLWFFAISLLPYVRNTLAFPLAVDNGLVTQTVKFSGYMLAGWWISTLKITNRKVWLGCLMLGIAMFSWSTWLVVQSGDPNSVYSAYTSPWIIIASMIIFGMLVNLEKYFNQLKPSLLNTLSIVSRISFGVFLIHTFVKEVVSPSIPQTENDFLSSALLWLAVSGISFCLIAVLYRIKNLRPLVT